MAGEENPFAKYAAVPPEEANPFSKYASTAPVTHPEAQAPAQPKSGGGALDTALDVVKSTGSGLVKGALAVGSLPGNVEMLGRMGLDKGAELLGYKSPGFSEPKGADSLYEGRATLFPSYGDYKADLERRIGTKLYDAQTTPGKYAETIAEFAPNALGGGGAIARASKVAVPAVASETAGQMTEGSKLEPWARMAGALVTPRAAMRTVTPLATTPERARLAGVLDQEGVTAVTAGARTGNKALKYAESVAQDMPFAGGNAAERVTLAKEQFTRAALRRAGIDAPRATQEVMDQAYTRLGNQFETLAARNTMRADRALANDLRTVFDEYRNVVNPTARAPVVENTIRDLWTTLQQNQGNLDGVAYQAFRSRLSRLSEGTRQSDPQLSQALAGLRNAVDNAMGRSITPADQAAWVQTRRQYRNLQVLERARAGAAEQTAEGLLTPEMLGAATTQQNRRSFVRGRGDFAELANAGRIMKEMPNSGTPARGYILGAAAGLAGAATGGVAGIPAAGAALAGGPALSRLLMSGPVQGYLGNQVMANPIAAVPRGTTPQLIQRETVAERKKRNRDE